ncbi:hypothetical protein BOSE62_110289 [Bosea sp. 62]|nr:hypothetical protein BOSE21B_50302 [Bosea sp. 21B]CAD5288738.1 hypothetical protein BOSE46_70290 [Bosea sp. 46]CAD5301342.1 hypothetical protein BOSE7B_90388 [Bosea sp. 7B]VVT60598.1 hypothetical protein BOS5A_211389 [Bosea sp. EC-HK365B]VXB06241.1 hypothetical protein BOSE62_110289 [Bosea sp. 62]VXB67570.1 hypothetical protein BOSE127_140327 [Bosea sp. 127]VXC59679.1 hypothetical protein BOSE29B_50291 [Bosea sp. 29B]VXC92067.1 hypothetical protein BOSE125_70355 [Bosea sp. 125]
MLPAWMSATPSSESFMTIEPGAGRRNDKTESRPQSEPAPVVRKCRLGEIWWSQAESNRRPLECHSSALPTELWPHFAGLLGERPGNRR